MLLRNETKMHRFFVEGNQISDQHILIQGDDFKHISRVLRLSKGDLIEVCDGKKNDYRVAIKKLSKDHLSGQILESYRSLGENENFQITLFQALAKGPKMEMIIQKNVELGIQRIYPFSCLRSIVELGKKEEKKRERWQRIAYEAAKQSKRGIIPEIGQVLTISRIAKMQKEFDLVLLAYEGEKEKRLKQVLWDFGKDHPQGQNLSLAIIVGPEGGFDSQEVRLLTDAGACPVSLGRRILRTETAGIVMVSQLNFWKEAIGIE